MNRGLITIVFAVLFVFSTAQIFSKTAPNTRKESQDEIQRKIQFIDYRTSTKSNVEFMFSNTGYLAHEETTDINLTRVGVPGCTWPRDSKNTYIFGMGICFGAKKVYNGDTFNLSHIAYNPSTGSNWMREGRIEDGNGQNINKRETYQTYFSDEYDKTTGESLDPEGSVNWPLWKKDNSDLGKLGIMVLNEEDRDLTTYPNGPAIISSQDVHCVYKDTDLQLYNGHSQQNLTDSGYPMRIQYEQTAYLYDNELYKDMVILRYKLINMSTDTLRDCWIGMISDNDLKISGPDSGQVNDVAKRYAVDESLNLCITWSDINKGEAGKGFGYLGNSLLESPAVDQNGNIRKDKSFFAPEEQLGLKTTKLFNISEDATILQNLYYQLSSGKHSINIENEDLRLLQSTGPFNMNPNDTAVCAYMINFANTVSGDEATGSLTDIQNLITNVINGRDLYYNKRLISGIEEGNKIPGEFNITNIYPNPADSKVNIEFNVSNDGKVNVELLDVLGNRLNGVNKDCDSGLNQITINTNELPSGNYIIKINNSGTSLTRLLSVLK